MKHIIAVNPVAGNKKGITYGIRIQKILKKYGIESEIHVSKEEKHLTKIATNLVKNDICRFYSVGGDGTLNELVQAVVNTDSEIVVCPLGTGNDFIKSINSYKSLRKIIIHSIDKKPTKVDVIKLNNNRYCINILSAGFDAMVGKNVEKFKSIPLITGKTKYNLSILYTLLKNQNFKFKIRSNNTVNKGYYTLVAISNGKYYGGGICPSPEAIIDDNIIDICIIDSTTLLTKIKLLPKYKKNKHKNLKQVKMYKTNKITIVSNKKFPINIDGEVIYTNKLKCEVIPKSINIIKK